jgi:zinc protease
MFNHRSFYVLALLVLSFDAGAVSAPVSEETLSNGLKIVVQEDHRSPVVVSQVWYKVGASYEYGGITGVSHMLEHMMFKGTQKHAPGEFSRIISVNGGSENAFTGQDYTAYFQTLERSRLSISFELEADRMRNLRLLPEEYAKEHQVVLEERRMRTDDQPRARLAEHFDALAYSNSPYRNPVIGWPEDIGGLSLDDLSRWYKQWYAPNNATLVVVGDVEPKAVFALAKKYFGALKPSQLLPAKPQGEVEQLGERRMTVKVPAKLPFLVMAYKVPVLKGAKEAWEPYAIEVLTGILDGGNSARLSAHLIRGQQLAASVSAGYDAYSRLPSLFTLEGTAAEGKTLPELEKALLAEVRQLQETPVSQEELDRVKAQVLAGKVFERDSIFYQAMQLGMAETVGLGWQVVDQYVEKINAVTADQIQQVAGKYLISDRLSVGYLDPLPIPEGTTAPEDKAPLGGQHVR